MQDIQTIAVVGLGYVGLPLALLADRKGFKVIGVEIDPKKVQALSGGHSYVDDVSSEELAASSVNFTADATMVAEAEAVIICVPTPVNEDKSPDLGPVKGAVSTVAPHLQPKSLLVLESTVNPGVCDELVIPLLEELSGKTVGKNIYLAHCPERINPGDPKWNVSNINRVIGANSKAELDLAKALYESLIDADVRAMGSLKEAEAVKVVENSFRDINIAFVNELAMSFHKIGININNVIDGAATKPFAFMPHYPGCGVGGHCIPVDPYYLIEYAHGHGFEHDFLRLARDINERMPHFTLELLREAFAKTGQPDTLFGKKVSLLGVSYKANIADERESPALVIQHLLQEAETDLAVFDPLIPAKSSVKALGDALEHADAVIVATAHDEFKQLRAKTLQDAGVRIVIDGRNILQDLRPELEAAGIYYCGIGV
jgi:UDP-N-acetyl-D-glucosamine dehydrogenase